MARINFRNCFIDHLWSDHLSSCQLCCCHPFLFEDHECELHQDVEDHSEEEDEVGSSRSFVKYPSRELQDRVCHSIAFFLLVVYVQYSRLVAIVFVSRLMLSLLLGTLFFFF